MTIDRIALENVFACIDDTELNQFALDLAAIPSPTGEEAAAAEFILDWCASRGLETVRQEVEEGRLNAVGVLRGSGQGGPSLMYNGHIDTGGAMSHEDIVGIVPGPAKVMQPYFEDGILYGTGMDNMKSGLAATIAAAAAIKKSGVSLKGDLIVASVAGEIGRAPVDQYQGRHYRGKGIGTRHLLTHGIVSDYAVVADVSHFAITWVQCGVLYAKVTTQGKGLYTPLTRRKDDPRESNNAIIKMTLLIEAVEDWARDYEEASAYTAEAGKVEPRVSIGSIAGGAPFRPSNTPNSCSIYVDVRIPPNRLPIDVQRELKTALDRAGVDYELEIFLSQRGYEHTDVDPLVHTLREAYELVAGVARPNPFPPTNSMWTDTNLYYEAGIPAVKFGLGGVLREEIGGDMGKVGRIPNSTAAADLLKGTKIYAATALAMCGVSR